MAYLGVFAFAFILGTFTFAIVSSVRHTRRLRREERAMAPARTLLQAAHDVALHHDRQDRERARQAERKAREARDARVLKGVAEEVSDDVARTDVAYARALLDIEPSEREVRESKLTYSLGREFEELQRERRSKQGAAVAYLLRSAHPDAIALVQARGLWNENIHARIRSEKALREKGRMVEQSLPGRLVDWSGRRVERVLVQITGPYGTCERCGAASLRRDTTIFRQKTFPPGLREHSEYACACGAYDNVSEPYHGPDPF
jgi:hypothetical protein